MAYLGRGYDLRPLVQISGATRAVALKNVSWIAQAPRKLWSSPLKISFMRAIPGYSLRKVYNCRERKNFRPPNIFIFPVKKCFIFQNFRRPIFSHLKKFDLINETISSISMFQPFQRLQVQLHKPTFPIIHSQNFTLFSILFYIDIKSVFYVFIIFLKNRVF